MFTTRVLLIICAVILLLIPTQSFSQQPNRQDEVQFIQKKIKRLSDYSKDFIGFADSQRNNRIEYSVAMDLNRMTTEAHHYLGLVRTLIDVYNLCCEVDRVKVRLMIVFHSRNNVESLNSDIQYVNQLLSFTKMPAMANSGTQLKEDLREIKAFFESIDFP